MDLSVIVSLYNKEACVTPLYDAIVKSVDPVGENYEILFADNGSKDNTAPIAAEIDHTRGKRLVTMEDKLQNDPADIPELVHIIEEGYGIVVSWRRNIPLYSEMRQFIASITSLAGTKIAEIKVKHHAIIYGESKYGLSRICKVFIDLLTVKTIIIIAYFKIIFSS